MVVSIASGGTAPVSAARRFTDGALAWRVLTFGIPLVVGMALYTSFNLVDMFLISRLENAAVALGALGICDMVAAVPTIISNGISTGSVAIICRRLGEGNEDEVARTTWQSMLVVGALSVIFGLAGIFGSRTMIFGLMRAQGPVALLATRYLRVVIGGSFSIFFLLQVTAVLRALGRPKTAAGLLVGGNLLNLLLNVVLVYGTGPRPAVFEFMRPVAALFHAPRMGMMGTAYATLIARAVPVLIGLAVTSRLIAGRRRPRGAPGRLPLDSTRPHGFRPDWTMVKSLLRIGWPSSAQLVVRIGAILVVLSLINASYVTATDTSTLTAYSICLRLETLVLFLGMGWGAAASSFIGTNLGAGLRERAYRAGWWAAAYDAVLIGGLVWVFTANADTIVGFFEHSPEVLAAGRTYIGVVGPSYVAVAVGVVLSQAMSGAGATMTCLVLDAAGLLLVAVPSAVVATLVMHAPPPVLWYTMVAGNVVITTAFAIAYATGRFLEKAV